jgi:anti-anti-sigma factor
MIQQPTRVATLVLAGELDTAGWVQLRDRLVGLGDDDVGEVVVDLGAVTFFDSSSVRAFIGARAELERRDIVLRIDRCSDIVRKVLEVTGVAPLLLDPPGINMKGMQHEPAARSIHELGDRRHR